MATELPEPMREHIAIEDALRAGRLTDLPESVTSNPAYPNVRDRYTWTPLVIVAISSAPVECVRELVDAGADLNVEVDDGIPAALNAVMSRRPDRVPLVEALADLGADPTARTVIDDDATPLDEARRAGASEVIPLLEALDGH